MKSSQTQEPKPPLLSSSFPLQQSPSVLDHLKAAYSSFRRAIFLLKYRWPIILEDKLGFTLTYYVIRQGCGQFTNPLPRLYIKNNEPQKLSALLLAGVFQLDDVINPYSNHTMIMEAVTLNRDEIFRFLLTQSPHLMLRDHLGQTVLHKAAALGRFQMAKELIEVGGVDPSHKDPWGTTAKDKARLHGHVNLVRYLEECEARRDELKIVQWEEMNVDSKVQRSRFEY